MLLDNRFLHDGHIGSASSFFDVELSLVGVEVDELAAAVGVQNENLTGTRFFMLRQARMSASR